MPTTWNENATNAAKMELLGHIFLHGIMPHVDHCLALQQVCGQTINIRHRHTPLLWRRRRPASTGSKMADCFCALNFVHPLKLDGVEPHAHLA
ncbi:hypothetical protein SAMN02787142_7904 [Burkholderia sp. WP9]|uniref:hypothetical protein n=1 Tax=Burkholderia sp. WP9 TaxID=1500263 RepID=UPI00089C4985|nr:hypothetical protein [Burkholderia sp. WP9]SEF12750.1 hypothetical protein SAMN02787142_7904 [Burkholderia sp. WP9]